ncbi:MAG: hypothetical protein ACYC44_00405 [Patescibacteria group bacterium]
MQEETKGLKLAIKQHWDQLDKKQKSFFVVFVLCAVVALVFTYSSVREGIYAPFRISIKELENNKSMLKDSDKDKENYQKRTDTDGDGLSDWDEEHLYHSSPYLWSTAGDGMPDNVKIAMGENPLCKHGEPCTVETMSFNLPTTTYPGSNMLDSNVKDDLGNIMMGDSQAGQNFRQTASEAGVDMSLDSAIPRDPALLRQALLQTGQVTQADLDKVSDQQLLQYFDEAKVELLKSNPNLAASSTATGTKKSNTNSNPAVGLPN